MEKLDEIILKRLKTMPPLDCTVVPGSTPVVAFGRFRSAKVATISLNPSYREFDIVKGKRRFHNLKSLGLSRYEDINVNHMNQVLDYCERYFERPGIVYKQWFNSISSFFKKSTDYDYYDGTACHLDLSQWETLDIWGKLNSNQKEALTRTGDLELLTEIIKHGQIHTLFLNGVTTSKEICSYLGIKPTKVSFIATNKIEGYLAETDKIKGVKIGRKINIIGWNVYLKYSSKDTVNILSEWVRKELKNR